MADNRLFYCIGNSYTIKSTSYRIALRRRILSKNNQNQSTGFDKKPLMSMLYFVVGRHGGSVKDKVINMNMKIPKNIRQIGECNSCQKIYIEDYVVTFLKQLAIGKADTFVTAVLYGKVERTEESCYCFVMGASECSYKQMHGEQILFFDEDKEQALRMQEGYFAQYDIIGWALLKQEENDIPKEIITKTHLHCFGEGDGLYYEMNTAEGAERFFVLESGVPCAADGYHIFYDKNEGMQNYLVHWNAQNVPIEHTEDRAARQFRNIYYNKQEVKSQKQVVGLLYTTTLMLLTLCCVLGISTINNYEKMKGMETALQHLALTMEEQKLPDVTQEVMSESVEVRAGAENVSGETISDGMPSETVTADTEVSDVQEEITEVPLTETEKPLSESASTNHTLVAATADESSHAVYIVQKGDTLLKISRRFYNSADMIDEICVLNQIENPNDIMQQQKILLP